VDATGIIMVLEGMVSAGMDSVAAGVTGNINTPAKQKALHHGGLENMVLVRFPTASSGTNSQFF
jgi:hypothetical protein